MVANTFSNDAIAAIATAPGRGGVGVIRISGKKLDSIIKLVCGRSLLPRLATFITFRDANGGGIDQGLALYFPAPNSFTGEDVLEIHGHGGMAVLQLLLSRCLEVGARLAEPGEFTKRSFLNNKIDLVQAESIADLIDASSEQAARSAMRSLSGEFSQGINLMVRSLTDLRLIVEGSLDFPDEDIDFLKEANAIDQLEVIHAQLSDVLRRSQQGIVLRDGLRVVLVGQPNVGKSSLLNRLAGEDVAIVTSVPGTTRDSLNALIHLDGVPFHIIDTAGLRDTQDMVEQLGIERTWMAVKGAGLILLVVDAIHGLTEHDQSILEKLPGYLPVLKVFNKVDLVEGESFIRLKDGLSVSAKTGEGLEGLRQSLLNAAGWHGQTEGVFLARERHIYALEKAEKHLLDAKLNYCKIELFAEDLRLAQQCISSITGEFSADDLLGEIFSRFCIGK